MHKILVFAAFGWLTLSGSLHFAIDVVSQCLRGKHASSPETTLFYGMNTAFALGQVKFGLLGLLVAWQALDVMGRWPVISLSLIAAACWLIFGFIFIEYWEPKFTIVVFSVLLMAAAITGQRGTHI
jgi:hypothetical protein